MSHWLRQQNRLLLKPFDYQKLSIDPDQIRYETFIASKIIFCEGPNLRANPYFNWLPLRPVKGETLDVQFQAPLPFMVNRGVFALPIDTIARIGSTFERKDLSWSCSGMGRSELEERLQRLIFKPYRVLAQNAGIRPATEDKRPFIGTHPKYEPLGVFNGLGTKGVSLAPYWAQEFFKFLELGLPLLPEVSINRYF
jgi:glycine/D-amino acid oxidase-like deaminating enzyme